MPDLHWAAQRAKNKANWDDRVAAHVGENSQYSKEIAAVKAGQVALQPTECLHLMCHIGTDTLSLVHAGAASVVGLDFSGPALAEAAKLAVAAGVPAEAARWVESDVFAAPEALNGEVFDLVVSTVGTLCWLPSVRDYARVVSKCLAPGGTFYIRDGHPMLMTLADDQTDGYNDRPKDAKGGRDLLIAYPYFETAAPLDFDDGGTYADPNAVLTHTQTHEWNHPLGLIVTELINAGLVIEFLHEHKELDWRFLDTMRRASDDSSQQPAAEDVSASAAEQTTTGEAGFGGYQFPAHQRDCVPCMFSLRARKPAAADMLPGQCPTDKDKKKGD